MISPADYKITTSKISALLVDVALVLDSEIKAILELKFTIEGGLADIQQEDLISYNNDTSALVEQLRDIYWKTDQFRHELEVELQYRKFLSDSGKVRGKSGDIVEVTTRQDAFDNMSESDRDKLINMLKNRVQKST